MGVECHSPGSALSCWHASRKILSLWQIFFFPSERQNRAPGRHACFSQTETLRLPASLFSSAMHGAIEMQAIKDIQRTFTHKITEVQHLKYCREWLQNLKSVLRWREHHMFCFCFCVVFWTVVSVQRPSRRLHRRRAFDPLNGTENGSQLSLTTRDREQVSVLEVRIEPGDLNTRPLTPQSVTLPTLPLAGWYDYIIIYFKYNSTNDANYR